MTLRKKRKTWQELNVVMNLPLELREAYRELCEQLLSEKRKEVPWPCLNDAVAQDVLLPLITVLGKKERSQKCYATGKLILPGQRMIIIKTQPLDPTPEVNTFRSLILADFFNEEALLTYLLAKKLPASA
jgi:hypothetical protein